MGWRREGEGLLSTPCEILLGRLFPRRRCDNSSGGLMEMASGCFAALYLAAPGGCSRAPCPDCFVWLPVVGLSAPLFKTPRKQACKFFCLRAAFGESYKNRSLHVGYLAKREYVLNNKSKRPKLAGPAVVVVTQAAANSPDFSILSYCTK